MSEKEQKQAEDTQADEEQVSSSSSAPVAAKKKKKKKSKKSAQGIGSAGSLPDGMTSEEAKEAKEWLEKLSMYIVLHCE